MNEIVSRIKSLMEERGSSINSFAKEIGIDQSNLNKKLSGSLRVTKNDTHKISESLGVNLSWLLNGDGEPYSEEGKRMLSTTKPSSTKRQELLGAVMVPFYDVDFALGYDEMYNDTPNVPTKFISIPGYEKADFWCRASGDRMKPVISNGDIVALKEVMDWQSFLPMNEVYAIMTTNDLRTVKVVRKGSDEAHFTLHAYNEEFEDQEIPKSAITKVFKVLGSLKAI